MTTPLTIDRDEYLSAVRHDRGPFTSDIDPDDYADTETATWPAPTAESRAAFGAWLDGIGA